MLLGDIYFKGDTIALRDVDGSEISFPLQDGLSLLDWLYTHEQDIKAKIAEAEQAHKREEYNRAMDERTHIIVSSVEKPWLPLHDGE